MILGSYYLTYGPEEEELAGDDRASTAARVPHRAGGRAAVEHGTRSSTTWPSTGRTGEGGHVLTTVGRIIFNEKIERALEEAMGDDFDKSAYEFINKSLRKRDVTQFVDQLVQPFGAAAISQVLDAFKDLGFHYATQAGITISKNDVVVPPTKPEILANYEELVQRSRTSTTRA